MEIRVDNLTALVRADRRASYLRLRGGFPVPLAGMIYWGALAGAGHALDAASWLLAAELGSGLIFPLALLLARMFDCRFMGDRTAVSSVLLPAFIGMLLFWPMLVAALSVAPALAPLILAIGMSAHWPVVGWGYDRTALFSAHAIVRAGVVFVLWTWMPEGRWTLLPLAVAFIYGATVLAILIDVHRLRSRVAA